MPPFNERLATVSYFPGVAQPSPARGVDRAAARGVDRAATSGSVGGSASASGDGWFVDDAAAVAHTGATGFEHEHEHEHEREREPRPESRAELAARAEHISMGALARKGMSSREMANRLRSGDLDEATIQFEVERLERVALLDDRELASTLVRTLQERKGLGRSGITAELRRRQVDPSAIEAALDELDGDDELSRATEIAVKRASQLRSFDTVTARRRLSAFLIRRGYSGSIVSAAVAAALEPARGPRFE